MKIMNLRSIIVIFIYVLANTGVLYFSMSGDKTDDIVQNDGGTLAPEYTLIEHLDYFTLKNGAPLMSLSANSMKSLGESSAEFVRPKGVYSLTKQNETIRYQGVQGDYSKSDNLLKLKGEVKLISSDSEYHADELDYYLQKDLVEGRGSVKFVGEDLKSRDQVIVESPFMNARPNQKTADFYGHVKGSMTRKKKYEGKMDFKGNSLHLDGDKSFVHLEGDVWLKREAHVITAGKADIYLENYNKTLKYFVLNDDVKVTEKLKTPKGISERKAFSERLEGFGREQKMVLTGAPRVEQGTDVIKGYKITIRENVDLIEVDDAMSDMKVKRNEKAN